MFWRESSEAPERREAVRAFVRERLGLALEFATLGAYELGDERVSSYELGRPERVSAHEGGGDDRLPGSEDGATAGDSPECAEVPDGAFRRDVSAGRTCGCSADQGTAGRVRPHAGSSGKDLSCGAAARTGECSALRHRDGLRPLGGGRQRSLRRGRGGDVVAPEQPCIWTGG